MTWYTDLLRTTPPASPETPQAPDDPRLQVLKQKAYAEALKNQKDYEKGQMVGNRYVAPSWTQHLATAVDNAMGIYQGQQGAQAQYGAETADEDAAQKWVQQRPVDQQITIPGDAPLPEGVPGPVRPDQQAIMPPSEQDMSNWIGAGMRRPLSRALATEVFKEHVAKAPERQAQREARIAEIKQRGEERIRQLQIEMERYGADRESRERIAGMIDNTRKEIAEALNTMHVTVANIGADSRRDVARIAADAKTSAAEIAAQAKANAAGKPVQPTIIKDLNKSREQLIGIRDSFQTFKPEYAGLGGYINKVSGTWNPFSGKQAEESANWWKTYENQSALAERHAKFGTALSTGEQKAWADATIKPGMKDDVIRRNLQVRANLARKIFNADRDSYIKGGHSGVEAAFDKEPVIFDPNTMKRIGDKIYQKTGPKPTDWEEVD